MKINNLNLKITSTQQLREWFLENHDKVNELWISIKLGKPCDDGNLYYIDAVEQALCFGWIDTTKKKYDDIIIQKFTPRRKKSNWTELNKERCRRLNKLGLMHQSGYKLCHQYLNEQFVIDDQIMNLIKSDEESFQNFKKLPNLYVRIRIDNIQSYKHNPVLFKNRLTKFLDYTKKNKLYGLWNDYERLTKY